LVLASGQRAEVILVPSGKGGALSAQRFSNELDGKLLGNPETIATIESAAGVDLSSVPSSFMMANARDLFAFSEKVVKQRAVTLSSHMSPRIDGKLFDANVVNFVAKKRTVEEWVITNTSPMYHPIHIHTWGFQIKGEKGWHDTVIVPPNTEKTIRIAFDDYSGTTVLHCHILDHEDTGMMAIIKVE
jgi:FtsP/CotA-like multicopper oxidase with cupredoxin domain